ncbi:hydrogenase maturation nickel metallochaperone HypA [Seonamhaeicola sp.]|uniref:hydrogenase maturation nickel metallochaperone HypA n=1 Tax=Seonamhaeicola sp. TaxID=1912245 RepID=UPI0026073421|nr:hydrogenase maturation nickel metallochaperone HypA [Seonamhaeicola sp.]
MHELSIALGIVKIAEDEAVKAKASTVESIELEIGMLSGVELDSLEFVWPSATKDTILEHSKRIINTIEGKAKCIDCDTIFSLNEYYDSCPKCQSNFKNILKGKELRVKALEVS